MPPCLLQEIVIEYITALLYKAMDSAVARGKGARSKVCPVGAEDIMFLVRKVGALRRWAAALFCLLALNLEWWG
jgi:hypothetical protein